MKRRLSRAVAVVTLAGSLLAGSVLGTSAYAATGSATIDSKSCNGRAYYYVLHEFTNPGHPKVPLRCGNSSFGLIHIVKAGHFESNIVADVQRTLSYGETTASGKKVLFDSKCNPLYTVIYGYNKYNGKDPKADPVGVITAYKPSIVVLTPTDTDSTAYRTNCPILI